jgi:hypothetical protein
LEGVVGAVEAGEEATLEAGVVPGVEAALREGLPEGEVATLEGAVEAADWEELDPVEEGVLPTDDIVAVLLARYDDCGSWFNLSGELWWRRKGEEDDEWSLVESQV